MSVCVLQLENSIYFCTQCGARWNAPQCPHSGKQLSIDFLRPAATGANAAQVGGTHYRKQTIQHWDYVIANGIPYMEAQVIKYVSRWRDKNGVEDLRKAQHFLAKLIEVETAAEDGAHPGAAYVNQG